MIGINSNALTPAPLPGGEGFPVPPSDHPSPPPLGEGLGMRAFDAAAQGFMEAALPYPFPQQLPNAVAFKKITAAH